MDHGLNGSWLNCFCPIVFMYHVIIWVLSWAKCVINSGINVHIGHCANVVTDIAHMLQCSVHMVDDFFLFTAIQSFCSR